MSINNKINQQSLSTVVTGCVPDGHTPLGFKNEIEKLRRTLYTLQNKLKHLKDSQAIEETNYRIKTIKKEILALKLKFKISGSEEKKDLTQLLPTPIPQCPFSSRIATPRNAVSSKPLVPPQAPAPADNKINPVTVGISQENSLPSASAPGNNQMTNGIGGIGGGGGSFSWGYRRLQRTSTTQQTRQPRPALRLRNCIAPSVLQFTQEDNSDTECGLVNSYDLLRSAPNNVFPENLEKSECDAILHEMQEINDVLSELSLPASARTLNSANLSLPASASLSQSQSNPDSSESEARSEALPSESAKNTDLDDDQSDSEFDGTDSDI